MIVQFFKCKFKKIFAKQKVGGGGPSPSPAPTGCYAPVLSKRSLNICGFFKRKFFGCENIDNLFLSRFKGGQCCLIERKI